MPIVTITLMKGRDPERLEDMTRAVSHAIADAIDAPIGTVRVIVHELEDHQYAVGGVPITEVKAERARAAAAEQEAGR